MDKYKTLIILDWDDTLFPTSWIVNNNIDLTDKNMQYKYLVFFSKLDLILYELLDKLTNNGQVAIITNAIHKWIDISSNILPYSQKIIKKKIIVISARDYYQKIYPDKMNMWKKLMFEKIANNYFTNNKYQHIISAGDAEYEYHALINLYNIDSAKNNRLLKTIKFIKEPSFEDLIDELSLLTSVTDNILSVNKHMDLKFKMPASS